MNEPEALAPAGDKTAVVIGCPYSWGTLTEKEKSEISKTIGPRYSIQDGPDIFTLIKRDDGARYYMRHGDAGRIILERLERIQGETPGDGDEGYGVSGEAEMYYLPGSRPPLAYQYDPATDIATIEGQKYTGEFFRHFTSQTQPGGVCVHIEQIEGVNHSTVIDLERLRDIETVAAALLVVPDYDERGIRQATEALDAAVSRPDKGWQEGADEMPEFRQTPEER